MKKAISKEISEKEDMKSEYDFSRMKGAVRENTIRPIVLAIK